MPFKSLGREWFALFHHKGWSCSTWSKSVLSDDHTKKLYFIGVMPTQTGVDVCIKGDRNHFGLKRQKRAWMMNDVRDVTMHEADDKGRVRLAFLFLAPRPFLRVGIRTLTWHPASPQKSVAVSENVKTTFGALLQVWRHRIWMTRVLSATLQTCERGAVVQASCNALYDNIMGVF